MGWSTGSARALFEKRRAEQKARWAAAPIIRCSCGASWRGRYAIDNKVIDAHRARPTCQVTEELSVSPNAVDATSC